MRILPLLILFTLFSCNVCHAALRAYVGTSLIYANINEPKYEFINEDEAITNPLQNLNSIYVGVSEAFKNDVIVSVQTNRLFNKEIESSVTDKKTGITLLNKSKITSDTLLLGKRFNRIIPSLLISNTKLEKSIFYNGRLQGSETKHAILYGANLGYLITRNVVGSLIYIAPNKELNLESAFGLSLNYVF